jgi:hypothetical protein
METLLCLDDEYNIYTITYIQQSNNSGLLVVLANNLSRVGLYWLFESKKYLSSSLVSGPASDSSGTHAGLEPQNYGTPPIPLHHFSIPLTSTNQAADSRILCLCHTLN